MLGLDHYEGRGWRGFHHHLTMSAIAYLFVVVDYLHAKKNFWPDVGTGIASDAAIDSALRGFCPCCLTEFESFRRVIT